VATLKAYGDESADGRGRRVFTVAAVVGHEDEWQPGIREWLRATRGLPFHATDLESNYGKTPEQRERDGALHRKLTGVLCDSFLIGFAVSLDLESHKAVFPPAGDGTGPPRDWPYYKALSELLKITGTLAMKFNELDDAVADGPVSLDFTFESRRKSNGAATALYGAFTREPDWPTEIFHSDVRFEEGDEPRLEPADLLAREAMHEFERKLSRPNASPRAQFSLLDECRRDDVKKFRFVEIGYEQWQELLTFVSHPERATFAQEYFDWLERTGRYQHADGGEVVRR
jgi:hypothetical protein